MRKIKQLLAAFALLFVSVLNVPNASATSVGAAIDYIISAYKIDIVVNENNTFDITEDITAVFNVPKHGIFRSIPLYNTVKHYDGRKDTKNRAKISDIQVSEQYTTESDSGNLKIKIGDPDNTLTGRKAYKIKYNYNIGKDPFNDIDELYFNIIGTEWDTRISNVEFDIHMPKDFDSSKVGFSTGKNGEFGNEGVVYHVNGKNISGSLTKALPAGNGLTIRVELPEGYFVGAGIEPSGLVCLYVIPVFALILIYRLWQKYGRDLKMFVKPEYFPPKGANSVDTAFMYKGHVSDQDALSLLVYLANKGYIKIEETEEKGFFCKKKGFRLTKLKNYEGSDSNELEFMKGLFKSGNSVTQKDLYNKFYKTTNKIVSSYNKESKRSKYFEKRGGITFGAVLFVILSFVAATIPAFVDYNDFETLIFALIFPGLGVLVTVCGIVSSITTGTSSTWKVAIIFCLFWGLLFGGVPLLLIVVPQILLNPIYTVGYTVGIVAVIIQIVLVMLLSKRTEYGMKKYVEVKGFIDFLETVEKDRLEQMVEEHPNYFYDILPYTYALGISKKWMKKFESINLKAPDWYSGSDVFDFAMFNSFMTSTMATASSSMSSSGGGSSGGGSGGGGGGSW